MKALAFETHGDVSVLSFKNVSKPEPQPGWTIIKVRRVALNHLDIWVRRGWKGLSLPFPHWTGSDMLGVVVDTDPESPLSKTAASQDFPIGSRVVVNPGYLIGEDRWSLRGEDSVSPLYRIIGEDCRGGLAEYAAVPTKCLLKVPSDIDDNLACAFLLTGTTVWRMLFERGGLKRGETILVVGSGGGVNSLSVLLAKHHGAVVIALAGDKEKKEKIALVGADYTICYKDNPDWHREVLKITGGEGVDIVIDNVGSLTFEKSLKSLRRGGRLLTVGNTSGHEISLDNRLIFSKQLSIVGSTMGSSADFKNVMNYLWQAPNQDDAKIYCSSDVSKFRNTLLSLIDCVEPFDKGIEMIRRLELGLHFGKIVLSFT